MEEQQPATVPAESEGKKKIQLRTILMCVFFPWGLFYLFWKWAAKHFKLTITAKTSLLYSALFLLSLGGYVAFVLALVLNDDGSGNLGANLVVGTIIIGAAAIIVFITFGAIASEVMLNPIKKIITQVDELDANDMSRRIDRVDSQDELNELTTQINEMLEEIEESFEMQKHFVSDASHELRTPIAVIQGYAELLDRWGKTDPAILEEAIGAIKTESQNMQSIVSRLLYLAKLGSFKPTVTEFSLGDVTKDIVAGYRLTAEDRNIISDIESGVYVESDKPLTTELVRIIADNAFKYTPAGGSVTITLKSTRHEARLTVADTGIGISEADLPHIFDRFYRCDRARTREQGSTGLGLAIAKSIAEMLEYTISVNSKEGEGTAFTISIPKKSAVLEPGRLSRKAKTKQ